MTATENAPRLNPRQAAIFCLAVLKSSIAARKAGRMATVPLMIGLPGVGKTSIARQLQKALKYDGLIVVTPTLHTTLDLRGLPYVHTGENGQETRFAASQILPKSGRWLVLVDELADCPLHEQSGFYQLLLDRRMGEYTLPPDCDVIGATNDETMGACANPLSTAIKTRVAPVYVYPDLEQSIKHALENGWDYRVIGFIRVHPEVLTGFNADDYAGGSTPRGLEQLSMLEQSGGFDLPAVAGDNSIQTALACSLLGTDHGYRYSVYRQLVMPNLETVFTDPDKAELPADPGIRFAFSAQIALATRTPKQFDQAIKYAARMDRVDNVGLVADIIRARPEFKESATFAAFCAKHGEIIL